jgi:uncharacterized membrane protein
MGGRAGRRGGTAQAVAAKVRGALWPIPCLGVLLAIGLGVLLPALDGWLQPGRSHPLTLVFGGGPSAARDVLASIAGSLISVTGLTFSFTVVALQLSSSQHSPRLLQTFVTDRVVQATLAQLVLTFVYALTVLRTVRTESATEDDSAFVPRLSITVAYLLTLGSVLALVLFLGHLSSALRVETMLRDVHDEATRSITRELDDTDDDGERRPDTGSIDAASRGPALSVIARSSGFLVDLDESAAVDAARQAGVVVRLRARLGDSVVVGTPMGHAWADPGSAVDAEALADALDAAVRLHYERSASRDTAYGLRKVIDIAVRALSPGTNDPTTAVHALSHASALLGELAVRPAQDRALRDADGAVRVVLPARTLPDLLQLAVEEPLQFAAGQPTVLRRLAALLREFAWRARDRGVDDLVGEYTTRVADTAARTTDIPEQESRRWRQHVADALAGHWSPETA